jgi:hypothetical protein
VDLQELQDRGYEVAHDGRGGLSVKGPQPTEELRRSIAESKQDLLTELFGEFLREKGPPPELGAEGMTDRELGELAITLLGETLQSLGRAKGEQA